MARLTLGFISAYNERVEPLMNGTVEAEGIAATWREAAEALAAAMAEKLNVSLAEAELSREETERAAELRREKYASEQWTAKL